MTVINTIEFYSGATDRAAERCRRVPGASNKCAKRMHSHTVSYTPSITLPFVMKLADDFSALKIKPALLKSRCWSPPVPPIEYVTDSDSESRESVKGMYTHYR